MKTRLIISAAVIFIVGLTCSMQEIALPTVSNNSFQTGEKLRYRITYGFIDAGEAVLEVKETSKKGNRTRDLYHIKGTGKTLGGFNAVYKVNDVYESYIDKKGIFPWQFVRRVEEGGYKLSQDYAFKQDKQKVHNGQKDFSTPSGIQDMISSFYYARTLNFKSAKVGDTFEFKCFMDDEIWPLKVKYLGDEKISIRKGKFNCMKFAPVVQTGRVFKKQDDLSFWVTKDENRIPILVKAKIPVGSIKLHLVEWSGLKHDLVKAK
ncbi:DUF3108 domain-containing protein [uncultured Fluviicola sp.]|uniref:DUF3108 domain-containing protein n=1 Tax=uncultured Fluviicola sp. TaxID=463303 RepID=UPI0025D2ED96|nr:DUF3108 domain-containing protein [uncultured Fluviicola sp.]